MENQMQFCNSCGAEVNEGDRLCPKCGAQNVNYRPSDESTRPVEDAPTVTPPSEPPKKSKKPLLIGLITGAVAVILIVVLLIVFLGGRGGGDSEASHIDALDTMVDFLTSPNIESLKKMIPHEIVSYGAEMEYNGDEDAFWDFFESNMDEISGDETLTYAIVSDEQLPSDELDEMRENYKSRFEVFDMSTDELTDARFVEVTLTTIFLDEAQSANQELTLIKYDGEWYVLSFLESFL